MKAFTFAAALAILVPAAAFGQTLKHDQMMHSNQASMNNAVLPQETGQSAFAAIQEIVTKLEADPATDWSKIDIEDLRQHLIDMDNVTIGAVVVVTQSGNSSQYSVSGDEPVEGSIKRIVMAHAKAMNGIKGWKFVAETSDTGTTLTVTPPDQASMIKLRALGFIGILTIGIHHQQHHWMLANGMSPHQ